MDPNRDLRTSAYCPPGLAQLKNRLTVAIPERTVRAMLATVRKAAFADDLPTTVVACLHDVVGADDITHDDFGPDRTTSVADPIVPPEIEAAWTRFGAPDRPRPHGRGVGRDGAAARRAQPDRRGAGETCERPPRKRR